MTIRELVKQVRNQTIRECQRVIVMHPDHDRYYLSAQLADMKLYTPNRQIDQLIEEYERSKDGSS